MKLVQITASGPKLELTLTPPRVLKLASVPPGTVFPQGPKGDSGVTLGHTFSYGNATPQLLVVIPAGKYVTKVRLDIYTPFDGVGAALSIGSSNNAQELMAIDVNAPSIAATFEVNPNVSYLSDTQVFLWITPGSNASTGNGQVFITT